MKYKTKDDSPFAKIETLDEAKAVIRTGTSVYFGVSLVQVILLTFLQPALVIGPIILAGLAYLVRKKYSLIAASILLALTTLSFITQALALMLTGMALSFVLAWAAFRAIQAALYLRKHTKTQGA